MAESEAQVTMFDGDKAPAPTSIRIDQIDTSSKTVADHVLGDQPAGTKDDDKLGFGTYVSAVAKFLTDSSTKIPLTLSIEGLWGSGKSSFMGLYR
jgi:predicted KAP-like P-loop ATPase